MTLAVQQSLFEAGGGTPMVESARWIEGVMLTEIALGVCVIAVALIGALMLTGRLPLREGMRVVIGCFVLLGAPVIAAALFGSSAGIAASAPLAPIHAQNIRLRPDHSPVYPGAGASLRND